MKIFFLGFVSVFVFCQIVSAQKNSPKGFAVYLLPAGTKTSALKDPDLKKLKPVGKPVIAESDIRYYQKDNHMFYLDYEAARRLKKINGENGTKPFAVFVGNEAIYVGAFWKSLLSQSFDGIVIDTYKALGKAPYPWWTDYPILILEPGYPSPEYFKGTDLRSDERILNALEKAGKLYDKVELVVKCKKITPSMKRRISFYFTFDVVGVRKGEYKEKEIEFELYDGKLLPELGYNDPLYSEKEMNFNRDQEIILEISQQVGREKRGWFLRDYRKK